MQEEIAQLQIAIGELAECQQEMVRMMNALIVDIPAPYKARLEEIYRKATMAKNRAEI